MTMRLKVEQRLLLVFLSMAALAQPRVSTGAQDSRAVIDSPSGVVADEAGGVIFASRRKNQIYLLPANGEMRLIAGSGATGYAGDGGPAVDAKLASPMGLARDMAGNIFVADTGNSVIRKLTPDGKISTVAGTGKPGSSGDGGLAVSAMLNLPSAVAVSSSGDLLIADTGNSRIRRVTPDGKIRSVSKTSGYGVGVAVDGRNNVYASSAKDSQVIRISSDGKTTVIAGSGNVGFGGEGAAATGAALAYPTGIAADALGNVYIADSNNYRVRKVSLAGIIETIAGSGTAGFGGDGGKAVAALIDMPQSIAADGAGNIFISDYGNNRIRRVSSDGIIDTFGAKYSPEIPKGFEAYSSQQGRRGAMAVDLASNLYIPLDGGIARLSADGVITTLVGPGATGGSGDAGKAPVTLTVSLAVDRSGALYIADHKDLRVRKVGADGVIQTIAGNGAAGSGGDGGPAIAAQFSSFGTLAVDVQGNVYIADPASHRVRRVTTAGLIETVAGNGLPGISGDGGKAIAARVHYPEFIAVDADGNLYITATGQGRVRKVLTDGKIVTVAGSGSGGFGGDGGMATAAKLNQPTGIAVDANGNLYIADSGNLRIRKVGPDGIIRTIAGSGARSNPGNGGPALRTSLPALRELGIDAQGNLFAAESEALRIWKLTGQGSINTVPIRKTTSAPITEPSVVSKTNPSYTQLARLARYQGMVVAICKVDTNGKLDVLRVLGGPFGLADNALESMRQWTFRPAVMNGTPVGRVILIEVNFSLRSH